MTIVIDIPEHIYEHAKEMSEDSGDEFEAMRAIANGTQQESRSENPNTCGDAISREAALNAITMAEVRWQAVDNVNKLPSVTPQQRTGRCKDCKWWKDSDGAYRRGVGAESQCPINCREVFEGNGYCYMFEPQECEDKE